MRAPPGQTRPGEGARWTHLQRETSADDARAGAPPGAQSRPGGGGSDTQTLAGGFGVPTHTPRGCLLR